MSALSACRAPRPLHTALSFPRRAVRHGARSLLRPRPAATQGSWLRRGLRVCCALPGLLARCAVPSPLLALSPLSRQAAPGFLDNAAPRRPTADFAVQAILSGCGLPRTDKPASDFTRPPSIVGCCTTSSPAAPPLVNSSSAAQALKADAASTPHLSHLVRHTLQLPPALMHVRCTQRAGLALDRQCASQLLAHSSRGGSPKGGKHQRMGRLRPRLLYQVGQCLVLSSAAGNLRATHSTA